MLKLPNSIEPAVMAENIVHLRDAESDLDGRVSDLEVTAPKDYSTTETATGQKWIDGKDIYKKVLSGQFPEITQTSNQIIGSLECDAVIDVTFTVNDGAGFNSKLNNNISIGSNTVRVASVSSGYSEYYYNSVILYTKPDPVPGDAKGPEDSDHEPEPEEKKTTKKKSTK